MPTKDERESQLKEFESEMRKVLDQMPNERIKTLWEKLIANGVLTRKLADSEQNVMRDGLLEAAINSRQETLEKLRARHGSSAGVAERYVEALANFPVTHPPVNAYEVIEDPGILWTEAHLLN